MPDFSPTSLWALAVLFGALGYFLKREHSKIRDDINSKVDEKRFIETSESWREEVRKMELHNKENFDRMQRQYDDRFVAVANQFTSRINEVERSLSEKMDLIYDFLREKK